MTDFKISNDGKITLTELENEQLEELVEVGDRGGFHYLYYQITDTRDSLLTAKI